jgi:hypothetical protein
MDSNTSRLQIADDGIVLLGSTAQSRQPDLIQQVASLNQRLSTSSIWSQNLGFGSGSSISASDIFSRNLVGSFNKDTLERYGLSLASGSEGTNFEITNINRAKLRALLSDEGINISDSRLSRLTNFSALDADYIAGKNTNLAAKLGFHEIGHGVSSALNADAELIQTYSDMKLIGQSSPMPSQAEMYIKTMAMHGAEEARAESVGFRGVLGMGDDTAGKFLQTISQGKNIAYANETAFTSTYGMDILKSLPIGQDLPFSELSRNFGGLILAGEQAAKKSFTGNILDILKSTGSDSSTIETIESGMKTRMGGWQKSLNAIIQGATSQQTELGSVGKMVNEMIQHHGPSSVRSSGGMSVGTLDKLIQSSLEAAKIMR